MSDINSGLGWSEAQWAKVNNTVTEAFDKASVVGKFLPCYGPLSGSAENYRDESLNILNPLNPTLRVTDDTTVKLFNLTVKVELSSEQIADDSMSGALLAFRRAANGLAQAEDDIVFNGFGPIRAALSGILGILRTIPPLNIPGVQVVSYPNNRFGLLNDRGTAYQVSASAQGFGVATTFGLTAGDHVVAEIAAAVVSLEGDFHPGPFACVLGARAFVEAHTPTVGLVLPADRITPLLNGPLLRSTRLEEHQGIVVSLAGNDIDIVVATPPKAQFLQTTDEAKYLFRVYEKFVLRIKDTTAVRGFSI